MRGRYLILLHEQQSFPPPTHYYRLHYPTHPNTIGYFSCYTYFYINN